MRNSFAPVFDSEETAEVAWKAVKEAQRYLPQWESFAQMIGRNPKIKLILTGGTPRTDGQKVYVQVPMALGRISSHERSLCGKRDQYGLQSCEACRSLEAVTLQILHETAHMVYGTFQKVSDANRAQAVIDGITLEARGQAESKRAAKIKKTIEDAPAWKTQDFLNLADLISPYLPVIVNCIEDTRVNVAMTGQRKGIRTMLEAWIIRYFREGSEGLDGKTYFWRDAPDNAQAIIAVYCETSELTNYKQYLNPDVAAKLDDPQFKMLCERAKKIRTVGESYTHAVGMLECLRRLGFCLSPDDEMDDPEPEPEPEDQESGEGEKNDSEPSDGEPDEGPTSQDTGQDSSDTGGEDDPGDSPQDGSSGPDTDDKEDDSPDQEGENGDGTDGGTGDTEADDEGDSPGSKGSDGEGDDTDEDPSSESGGSSDHAEGDREDDGGESDDSPGGSGSPGGNDEADGNGEPGPDGPGDEQPSPPAGTGDQRPGQPSGQPGQQQPGQAPESNDEGGAGTSGDYVKSPEPITAEQQEEMGTPEKVSELFAIFGGHAKPEDFDEDSDGSDKIATMVAENDNSEEEAEQIDVAIEQSAHFDHVSNELAGLNVWRWPDHQGIMAFGGGHYHEDVQTDRPSGTLLAPALQKLRILFTENRKGAKLHNLKRGKVDPKKVGQRFATNDPRMFRKRLEPGKKDYFVCIGFDVSGSTGGRKLKLIKASVAAMGELMNKLGVKFAVYAHSGSGDHVEIFEIKGPQQPWSPKVYEALDSIESFYANLDGHTLEYYRKIVQSRQETDKVLFFYTDGALNNIGEEYEVFTENVEILRQLGVATVGVEVGVRSGMCEQLGMDTVRIDGAEDTRKVVDKLEECLSQVEYASHVRG